MYDQELGLDFVNDLRTVNFKLTHLVVRLKNGMIIIRNQQYGEGCYHAIDRFITQEVKDQKQMINILQNEIPF